MKVINTRNAGFKRFLKNNGAYLVLALVVFAALSAVYVGSRNKIRAEINSSGGDNSKWSLNSETPNNQTNTQPSSSQPSQQQPSSQLQSKPSNIVNSSQKPQSSAESQRILYISPVNGEILNKFSNNKPVKSLTMGDWRLHNGIDIACEKGTSVKASGQGTVTKVYTDDMWGTTVEIEHPDGRTTIYSSLSDKVFVEKGQAVESTQMIGTVDNTAKVELSEQTHLHFAVKKDGKYENPQEIITYPINQNKQ